MAAFVKIHEIRSKYNLEIPSSEEFLLHQTYHWFWEIINLGEDLGLEKKVMARQTKRSL